MRGEGVTRTKRPITRLGHRLEEMREEAGYGMEELTRRIEAAGYKAPRAERVPWQTYQYLVRRTRIDLDAFVAVTRVYSLARDEIAALLHLAYETGEDVLEGRHPRSGR